MATKQIELPEIGIVTLAKRKDTRSIRLRIDARGQVSVTLPYWTPYEAGLRFIRSKIDWIRQHQQVGPSVLQHGQIIGKSHHLYFETSPVATKITSKVDSNVVRVTYPVIYQPSDPKVQSVADKACIKALRIQAEMLMPDRLHDLAALHGFRYTSVQVKQLTGRWGSCDSHQNIVFNLFLMQLPWTLVDYVILHELTHTKILRHGPDFWSAMKQILPDTQVRRRAMKAYRPIVSPSTQP